MKATQEINLIPIEQAAKDAGCSPSWLRKLAADGRVISRKVTARCYLVDRRSVERFFGEPRKTGRPRKLSGELPTKQEDRKQA